jgi:hypothetical protein
VDAGDGEVVLSNGSEEVAVWPLVGTPVDLGLVDALARLQLAARRAGVSMVLRRPSPELCGLLDLVGLGEVIEGAGGGLAVEPVGQAEGGEQLGVEEVLPGGDLPA